MNKKQSVLKVDSILEYYDSPQLLTARDCFDTLYLCLLYEDYPQCKYTAIRISPKRLNELCKGKRDLRSLYLMPEGEKEYFVVTYDENKFILHQEALHDLQEDKLPADGYFLDKSEKESVIVSIPTKDKVLFSELVKKFGWACM